MRWMNCVAPALRGAADDVRDRRTQPLGCGVRIVRQVAGDPAADLELREVAARSLAALPQAADRVGDAGLVAQSADQGAVGHLAGRLQHLWAAAGDVERDREAAVDLEPRPDHLVVAAAVRDVLAAE